MKHKFPISGCDTHSSFVCSFFLESNSTICSFFFFTLVNENAVPFDGGMGGEEMRG